MFKNLQLVSGWVGQWNQKKYKISLWVQKPVGRCEGKWSGGQQVAVDTDDATRKIGVSNETFSQDNYSKSCFYRNISQLLSRSPSIPAPDVSSAQQGAAWEWKCGENEPAGRRCDEECAPTVTITVQSDRARMSGESCCGHLLCALCISIFRCCPKSNVNHSGRKEVVL